MLKSFEKINLRKKFLFLSSIIMVAFALLLSGIYYVYMKQIVVQDALEKSKLILQEVEAIRGYVIEELRPKMYELHGDESFILEAMSTTYVSIRIMRLFQEKMAGYIYRRVSQNPRNPKNSANPWEDEMFDWFAADKSRLFWQGQVESDTSSSFISVIPDYIEKECLSCHGDAKDAPESLIRKYGDVGGFRFSEGDLAGLNSVSIPIAKPLSRLRALTGVIFILSLGGSLLLLLLVNVLFDKLVVSRLAWIVDSLQENTRNFNDNVLDGQSEKITTKTATDELDSLQTSFRQLNRYVRTARRGDNVQPNFIGPYAIANPIAMGAMSWLYQGVHSETQEEVLLKIPLNNLSVNPLYRACLQTELKIMQYCDHQNILEVKERIDDILILHTLRGSGVMNSRGTYEESSIVNIFNQIFDLVAYLHTNDIVHHDLRPGNFFLTKEYSPVLMDLGLAHSRQLPDTIFDSGIGPQGDFRYMAPEQVKGLRGDPRSDLYSLGVMLFNVYTGSFPHSSETRSRQAWLKTKGKIAKTIAQHQQLPTAGLGRIIAKAMAYDLQTRYQWVEDLRDDFIALNQRD